VQSSFWIKRFVIGMDRGICHFPCPAAGDYRAGRCPPR
jgi:hypothetical protein